MANEDRDRAESYIEHNETGMYVPVDRGEGVHFPEDSVGSGPLGGAYVERRNGRHVRTSRTANGYLKDLDTKRASDLWITEFTADFAVTGMDAQSKYKQDFYPRFFTQPRYTVKAQCFNQEQYNRIVKLIRQSMIRHLATGAAERLFQLRIEDRTRQNRARRTTRGGYRGWTLNGYIENVRGGAERFVNAPEIQFTFVLVNAEEGIMKSLDGLQLTTDISKAISGYLEQFRPRTPNPDVERLDPFEQDKKKPTKKPPSWTVDKDEDRGPRRVEVEETGLNGRTWEWLME